MALPPPDAGLGSSLYASPSSLRFFFLLSLVVLFLSLKFLLAVSSKVESGKSDY